MRITQKEKVLKILIRRQIKERDRFFKAFDFQDYGDIFIGYKGATRFVELCNEFPEMIDSKMDGKYRIGRLRLENTAQFMQSIPENYRIIVEDELSHTDVSYKVKKMIPFQVGGNTVQMQPQLVEGNQRLL